MWQECWPHSCYGCCLTLAHHRRSEQVWVDAQTIPCSQSPWKRTANLPKITNWPGGDRGKKSSAPTPSPRLCPRSPLISNYSQRETFWSCWEKLLCLWGRNGLTHLIVQGKKDNSPSNSHLNVLLENFFISSKNSFFLSERWAMRKTWHKPKLRMFYKILDQNFSKWSRSWKTRQDRNWHRPEMKATWQLSCGIMDGILRQKRGHYRKNQWKIWVSLV